MIKLVFAVVALAIFFGQASASHTFNKELTQTLDTCIARLPPAVTDADANWVATTTRWYLKYSDEIFWNLLLEIFLTGREDRPLRESQAVINSPCITANNQPYIDGVTVSETWTSGALNVQMPVRTTYHNAGVTQYVFNLPNSQTPAATVNWVPVLTNGRTFILQFSCLPEGHFGFQVFTTVPELDADSIQQIKEYLNKAGFDDVLGVSTLYRASQCTNKP